MTSAGMRSGRGTRLPGMGTLATPATPPTAAIADEPPVAAPAMTGYERSPAQVTPKPAQGERRGRLPNHGSARRGRAADKRERNDPASTATGATPAYVPHADDTKIQVNPRIYRGIWRHYEQLVDELPRERRRGALTALVNAVLAQHAPRNVAEARDAIAWLRRAEACDAADTRERIA